MCQSEAFPLDTYSSFTWQMQSIFKAQSHRLIKRTATSPADVNLTAQTTACLLWSPTRQL